MATAGFEATPKFWDGAAAEAARIMDAPATQPQNLANICWAFAKSGCGSPDAVDALFAPPPGGDPQAGAKHGGDLKAAGFTPQELANLAWAYACADHVDGDLLLLLWRAIVKEARESPTRRSTARFNLEELRQLQQVVLHAKPQPLGAATAGDGRARDDRDEFSALKVSELRQLCDDRGLDTRQAAEGDATHGPAARSGAAGW
ncbi:hypothetical protein JL720_12844 [Aureococcus anophagefferens]|nr:hypothetical protein JL720_12844 [Aureococcus anophagefferens]